mgnify:CR=1 FL=1
MPITIPMNKGEVLSVVILVADEIIEHHQSINFPQLGYTMRQHGAHLKNMLIVDTRQPIISTDKTSHTNNMQFALRRSVKTLHSKVFTFEKPRIRHFDSALFSKQRIAEFIHTDTLRISLGSKLYQPLFAFITSEDLGTCATRGTTTVLKFLDAFPLIFVAVQYSLSFQCQLFEIGIILSSHDTMIRTELQSATSRRPDQCEAIQQRKLARINPRLLQVSVQDKKAPSIGQAIIEDTESSLKRTRFSDKDATSQRQLKGRNGETRTEPIGSIFKCTQPLLSQSQTAHQPIRKKNFDLFDAIHFSAPVYA